MKIRAGFVSNSSSSSFLILGDDIEIKDVTFKMIKERSIYVVGTELSTGSDVFQIKSIEQLAFLKAFIDIKNDFDFQFIDAFAIGNGERDGEINIEKLPGGLLRVRYYTLEKDYCSSTDLSDLKERYDEYDEVTRAMQKYLRAKKIKNLENKE